MPHMAVSGQPQQQQSVTLSCISKTWLLNVKHMPPEQEAALASSWLDRCTLRYQKLCKAA